MQKWARPLEHPVTISGNRRMWNIPNYFLANLAIADLGKIVLQGSVLQAFIFVYLDPYVHNKDLKSRVMTNFTCTQCIFVHFLPVMDMCAYNG